MKNRGRKPLPATYLKIRGQLFHATFIKLCQANLMARPLRLELAGGLYHMTLRGDRHENIYDDDKGRER